MICRNGFKLAAGKSTAARGFFSLFYQWSQTGCVEVKRNTKRNFKPRDHLALQRAEVPIPKDQSREDTAALLKQTMRYMPHSVVVLTTTEPISSSLDSNQKDISLTTRYRGMALSSFTTLTLTPEPIVTFNIRKPSLTLEALRKNTFFNIHILEASKAGATLADAFTKGNTSGSPFAKASEELKDLLIWEKESEKAPMLLAEGVTKILKCELIGNLEDKGMVHVGDHVLVLGKVVNLTDPGTRISSECSGKDGLGYAIGKYRYKGASIPVKKA